MTKIAKCYAKMAENWSFFEFSTFKTKLDIYICAELQCFWYKNKACPFSDTPLAFGYEQY